MAGQLDASKKMESSVNYLELWKYNPSFYMKATTQIACLSSGLDEYIANSSLRSTSCVVMGALAECCRYPNAPFYPPFLFSC